MNNLTQDTEISKLSIENERLYRENEILRESLGRVHKIRAISMSGGQPSNGDWVELYFSALNQITKVTDDMLQGKFLADLIKDGK